jgi:membrane-bound metal-dependent hydrolase YbcI (DUF457 family)
MFVGHIALALAAKRVTPRTNLGLLALGAQWADTLWPILLLVGMERVEIRPGVTVMTPLDFVSYPWSHSLLMLAVWGVLAYIARRRGGGHRAAAVLGGLVVSHWVLDVVTHRPDMPLVPFGGSRLGLGLWNYPAAELLLEATMYAGGAWLYFRSTRPRDAVGRWAVPALLLTLGVIWLAASFGPPPPSVDAVAWSGLIGWLFFAWAWWGDAH